MIMKILWEKPSVSELQKFYQKIPWPDAAAFAPKLITDSWNTVCIRDLQNDLVGFAAVFASNEIAHVSDVAIIPSHRGKGYGRLLINEVKVFTKKQGFRGMKLDFESTNEGFYRRVLQ